LYPFANKEFISRMQICGHSRLSVDKSSWK